MKYPAKAFQDNKIKLQKSRRAVRDQYDDFMTFFETDEVFGSGHEILRQYKAFFDYQVLKKLIPTFHPLFTCLFLFNIVYSAANVVKVK